MAPRAVPLSQTPRGPVGSRGRDEADGRVRSGTLTAVPGCFCAIAPPSLLLRLAEEGSVGARRTLDVSDRLRARRFQVAAELRAAAVPPDVAGSTENTVDDVAGGEEDALPGRRARGTQDPPVGDEAVDEAFDGAAGTAAFFREVFARESIDGRGLDLVSSVHFGRRYDNAFWTGEQMVYGDGGGGVFVAGGLTRSSTSSPTSSPTVSPSTPRT